MWPLLNKWDFFYFFLWIPEPVLFYSKFMTCDAIDCMQLPNVFARNVYVHCMKCRTKFRKDQCFPCYWNKRCDFLEKRNISFICSTMFIACLEHLTFIRSVSRQLHLNSTVCVTK